MVVSSMFLGHAHARTFILQESICVFCSSAAGASIMGPSPYASPSSSSSTSVPSSSHMSSSSNHVLERWSQYMRFFKDLVAGGVAGAISRTVVSPLERMKILFQIQVSPSSQSPAPQSSQYKGILQTLVRIGREEGWRGYFKGNGTNILRIVPYSAVQFASYEKYKTVNNKCSARSRAKWSTPWHGKA